MSDLQNLHLDSDTFTHFLRACCHETGAWDVQFCSLAPILLRVGGSIGLSPTLRAYVLSI